MLKTFSRPALLPRLISSLHFFLFKRIAYDMKINKKKQNKNKNTQTLENLSILY